jgi:hypothetical protein
MWPRSRHRSTMWRLPPSRDDIRTLHFVREQSGSQLIEIARLVDAGQANKPVRRPGGLGSLW